ncbi:hypothetical protein [Amycolatopsis echigonensis]|uniref:Uncharacterized protein n=1 Tax=Amycolatopsis echigonensis TaxID=2576905 RepID=A0A2N3WED2_9PSEU|nr:MULTISPECIES: hypothetical protein [Amycolatopsis]MBB2499662.1 hypothetical protein [Amycolatopsis echigonensis]PKV92179.1 hypothetical protein ATK30_2974 [Amycolatopsis niigatensis]
MTVTHTPGALDLAATDFAACTGLDVPHAFYDELVDAWYAAGTADPAAALALIQDAAESEGGPYPTTADLPAFRERWFADARAATEDDPAVSVVDPAAPGAFPALVWRTHADAPHASRAVADTRGGFQH